MKMKWAGALLAFAMLAQAETSYDAWLRYAPIDEPNVRQMYEQLPATIVALDPQEIEKTAQAELERGIRGMLGRTLRIEKKLPEESCILLGTLASLKRIAPGLLLPETVPEDGYLLKTTDVNGHAAILIAAAKDRKSVV